MSSTLAAGLFLTFTGLVALSFGLYALLRGGRGQRGGIGPFSERGIHVIAGVRITLIGTLSLVAGGYLLWISFQRATFRLRDDGYEFVPMVVQEAVQLRTL